MRTTSLLLSITLLTFFSLSGYAQTTIINFDGSAAQWGTGKASPENTFELTDNFTDFEEGIGSLQINTELKLYAASWGTWTDAAYNFPAPLDISGSTDLRLRVKIIDPPAHNRSMQFTLDIFDSSAQGQELWRYMEDLDLLYHHNIDAIGFQDVWHEVIIPLSRMAIPVWSPTLDGAINLDKVLSIHFGIHGDSTFTDTVVVLFDDLRAAASDPVGVQPFLSGDEAATGWLTGAADPANSLVIENNFVDFVEGVSSFQVTATLVTFPATWGTWTDAGWVFPTAVDLTGATEVRFWMKIINGGKRGSFRNGIRSSANSQFTFDLFDNPATDTSTADELWRFLPAGGGIYGMFLTTNHHAEWNEIVIPFTDFGLPSWSPPINNQLDLESIVSVHFGIHADSDLSEPDTVIVLFDNFYATKGKNLSVGVDDYGFEVPDFSFALHDNYPNPFNPSTTLSFELPENGNVSLKIYNLNGQEVYTVIDNRFKFRGEYEYNIDLSNLASGVYFYTLRHNNNIQTKKMTLIK